MVWHKVTTKTEGGEIVHKEEEKPTERSLRAQKHAEELYRLCKLIAVRSGELFDNGWGKIFNWASLDLKQTLAELDAVLKKIEE